MMRVMLYEAAQAMMRSKQWFWLKDLGNADRQAPQDEEGNRGTGAQVLLAVIC